VGVAGRRRRGSGGCAGFAWSRLIVGEAEAVPGDGVVDGVLRVLRLGSAMATDACGMVNVHHPVGNPKRKV
jgi:hypothetical protein